MAKFFTLMVSLFLPILFARAQTAKWVPMNYLESGFSERNLLSNARIYPHFELKRSRQSTSRVDTIKILAIRVEFQEDTLAITTGNGKFDLSTSSQAVIDPPPHDLDYFENHLRALSNYYHAVSGGKLTLQGEVFPKTPTASYTLSHCMDYYNPNTTEEELYRRLAELLRDAFTIADSNDSIDFSKFDSFIVFHAGVGNDLTFDYDPTPNDIPSVFLDFETLKRTISADDPSFQGIPVNGRAFFIREGILLPETESQEGVQSGDLVRIEFGLLGTAALMFGHQLGLPSLFDTDGGRSGIGRWGLMDQGSGNFSGLLPAQPCAWSKVFLGWEKPITVTNGYGLKVAAANTAHEGKIYKIPINSKEYFLLENRQRDVNGDGIAIGRDSNGNRIEFHQDGTISASSPLGVITAVDEYDFGLLGSGILIWHVDESIIEKKYKENRINTDPNLRGVDLEEADGSQDIGQYYGVFHPGGGSEYGVAEDAFYKNNEVHKNANRDTVVAFTPTTTPDSRSNSGANSHVVITNFSDIDSVMTFDLSMDYFQEGFPQFMGLGTGSHSTTFGDLDGNGKNEIVICDRNGKVFAWRSDGSKFIANSDSAFSIGVNGDTIWSQVALFAQSDHPIGFAPTLGDLNDDGKLEVIAATEDGWIYAWQPSDSIVVDGRADLLFAVNAGSPISTPSVIFTPNVGMPKDAVAAGCSNGEVVVVSYEEGSPQLQRWELDAKSIAGICRYGLGRADSLAIITTSGILFLLTNSGEEIWRREIPAGSHPGIPAAADLTHDGRLDILVPSQEGGIVIYDHTGTIIPGFPSRIPYYLNSTFAIADIDGDGYLEILTTSTEKELLAFNHNGRLVNNFPIQISGLGTFPILGDVDGDGDIEMVLGTSEGYLTAYQSDGTIVDGFPLSTGGPIYSTPALLDLDGDGDIEIATAAEDGYLYVWDLPGKYDSKNVPWGSYLHDAQHSGLNPERRELKKPSGELMPSSLVYNYPNPTEGDFTTIRYTLNYMATVNIRIYDLAGELVDELTGTGFPGTENEVIWNLKDVESGVYLARVEARGTEKNSFAIIKIAVVK